MKIKTPNLDSYCSLLAWEEEVVTVQVEAWHSRCTHYDPLSGMVNCSPWILIGGLVVAQKAQLVFLVHNLKY